MNHGMRTFEFPGFLTLVLTFVFLGAGCSAHPPGSDFGNSNGGADTSQNCQALMANQFQQFKTLQNQWYVDHHAEVPAALDQSQFIAGSNGHVDILVHGFTSSPRAMKDLADSLAARGDTVITPLLTGFGIDGVTANQSTEADWAAAFDQSLQIGKFCGSPVAIIAHSLGGAIVSDSIYNHGASGISRLVMLAPFFKVANPRMAYLANMLASRVDVIDMKTLKDRSFGIDPYSWLPIPRPVPGQPEPYFPMKAMREVLGMQDLFTKDGVPPQVPAGLRSPIPVFLVTSLADSVVDGAYASEYLNAISSQVTEVHYAASEKMGHSFENANGNPEFRSLAEEINQFLN